MNLFTSVFKKRVRLYTVLLLALYPLLGISYLLYRYNPQWFYWRAWEYFDEVVYANPSGAKPWQRKEKGDLSRHYIFRFQRSWQTEVHCDDEGFRRVPLSAEQFPILVAGDSHIWGSGLSDHETIPWQLAEQLQIPVFNGGRTEDPLPHLLQHPRLQKTKLIIELVAEHRISKMLFHEEFQVLPYSPFAIKKKSPVHPCRYFLPYKLLRHVNFLALFREVTARNFNEYLIHHKKTAKLNFSTEDARLAALNIARRAEVLRSLGYKYIFGIIPNRKYALSQNKDPQTAAAQIAFDHELVRGGVDYINLRGAFSQNPNTLFQPTDSHISPQGAFLIAERLADAISTQRTLLTLD